ncbi:MAG: family 20 glycosylhydrolase [Niabella sp.]|nr:family 20 glycosylhydrolase [Niabella sp.]
MMKKIKRVLLVACILNAVLFSGRRAAAQTYKDFPWKQLPVRGLMLNIPQRADVEMLCRFIKEALPAEGVNTLALRIEWWYQFESHPELAATGALSKAEMQQIVRACKEAGIRLVPMMNLLGHQSEQTELLPLLAKYPQFDESPDLNPPVPWKYGNWYDFYHKSLCPAHPDLLKIIFPLMDELIEVCGAADFHVGLDEAWIIGYEKCPRCGGRDKAEILAEYIRKLHAHLQEKKCRMWMWGDRLIDGKTTNLLGWQASMNNTHRAIDMIPKDIMITDWKYENAPPTPAYFAIKGFDVLASACADTASALAQLEQIYAARKDGTRAEFAQTLAGRMQGVLETTWISTGEFIRAYYGRQPYTAGAAANITTFKNLFRVIRQTGR